MQEARLSQVPLSEGRQRASGQALGLHGSMQAGEPHHCGGGAGEPWAKVLFGWEGLPDWTAVLSYAAGCVVPAPSASSSGLLRAKAMAP